MCASDSDCITDACPPEKVCRMRGMFQSSCDSLSDCAGGQNFVCDPAAKQCRQQKGDDCDHDADCVTGLTCGFAHFLTDERCAQKYDVGVWSAQGLGGQFIVGHQGLDLIIVAKNYGGGGPTALWTGVRPALVKLDATYKGDEAAFCKAYGKNDYAPDLIGAVTQPQD